MRAASSVSGCLGSCVKGLAFVGPSEWFRRRVIPIDGRQELCSEVVLAGEDSASEESAGENLEEQLDLVSHDAWVEVKLKVQRG